jgi:AcrR family transcriptional regulator
VNDAGNLGLRERKKLDTWRAIRAAGLRLFEEQGYEAVSIDTIAAAANVSRSTLFNYFPAKEAIVFAPDPEERQAWRALMSERPTDEPLWLSLQAVLLGYLPLLSARCALQKRLRMCSATLRESAQGSSEQFINELREWTAARTPADQEVRGALLFNTAQAVLTTAYTSWSTEDSSDRLVDIARECFHQTTNGFGPQL